MSCKPNAACLQDGGYTDLNFTAYVITSDNITVCNRLMYMSLLGFTLYSGDAGLWDKGTEGGVIYSVGNSVGRAYVIWAQSAAQCFKLKTLKKNSFAPSCHLPFPVF